MNSKKIKNIIVYCLVFMMMFSFSGCSNKNASGDNKNAGGQKQEDKVKIIIARPVDSDNLDPVVQSQNTNIWLLNLAMEGLVKSSDDGTKIEPNLAEKWEISDDGLTYTFHIIKDLKFSDATPVEGKDWEWSLIRARDEEGSPWKTNLQVIDTVKAKDDQTLVITLKEVAPSLLSSLSMFNTTVASKDYFDGVGDEQYSQKPIGTGPYIFNEWSKGEYISMIKNENYRVKDQPKTYELKFTVVPDDQTRVMQLQAGDIDIATSVPFSKMSELSQDSNLKVKDVKSTMSRFIAMNCGKGPLNDVKVRQAINYGIDKDGIRKLIMFGYGQNATSFFSDGVMYWNDQVKGYEYDPEKAKQLLKEAGYEDGLKLELLLRSGDAVAEQIGVTVKEHLSKIGIDISIKMMERATVNSLFRTFKYDLCVSGWSSDMIDPVQAVTRMAVYDDESRCYYTQWKNDEAMNLAKKAEIEKDEAKRKEMYYQVQQIYRDEAPLAMLYYDPYPVVMTKNIEGFVQTPLGNYRFENLVKTK